MSKDLKNYIAGSWCTADTTFEKRSPYDDSVVALVHEATENQVSDAVQAGKDISIGQKSSHWGDLPQAQRLTLVRGLTERLLTRVDDIIEAEVADTGRSYWQARNFDGARAAGLFESYANMAASLETRSRPFDVAGGQRAHWTTARRPKGVVACICPWNVPFLMACMKTAPALAMGNAAILKPSEDTPSSATILAEVIHESDIPDGVFSLVHGFGANSAGAYLTQHPDVHAITFTGDSTTGSVVMKAAADGLRDVSLELGGKNAALVFADARMDRVVEGIIRSAFFNCGQICFCTERVYVHHTRFDEFVSAMATATKNIVVGNKHHDGFNIGPLISHRHRDKVSDLLTTIPADGGEFVTGGQIPEFGDIRDNGAFINPSIAIGLPQTARFVQRESFGPVMHVAPFYDEAEAIHLANDTNYGLAVSIWTENINRAQRVAPRIRVGHAWINSWQLRDLLSPLTGAGISGVGRSGRNTQSGILFQPQTITTRLFEDDV